jgi:hypothetical protein
MISSLKDVASPHWGNICTIGTAIADRFAVIAICSFSIRNHLKESVMGVFIEKPVLSRDLRIDFPIAAAFRSFWRR